MKTTEQEPTVIDACKVEQDNKAAAAEASRLEQKHRILNDIGIFQQQKTTKQ